MWLTVLAHVSCAQQSLRETASGFDTHTRVCGMSSTVATALHNDLVGHIEKHLLMHLSNSETAHIHVLMRDSFPQAPPPGLDYGTACLDSGPARKPSIAL